MICGVCRCGSGPQGTTTTTGVTGGPLQQEASRKRHASIARGHRSARRPEKTADERTSVASRPINGGADAESASVAASLRIQFQQQA